MLFAAFGVLASACAGDGGSGASGGGLSAVAALPRPVGRADEVPTGRAVTGGRRLDVAVYYLRTVGAERYLAAEAGTVPFSVSVDRLAREVVTELLTGRPRCLGMERPFPVGTRLLGLRLAGGTAVVNLSREALGAANADGYALQTLVWTVTQLPEVRGVVVRVEGRSGGLLGGRSVVALLGVGRGGRRLVRDRSLRLAPILLRDPAPRAAVAGDRVVARGEARVVGGAVGLRLRDGSGRVVSQGFATLASSPPAWGRFSGALVFTAPRGRQLWRVEAFEVSPVDASVTYSVVVPIWVGR